MVRFPVAARRIITLTTDFGLRDGYVACMKGVILSITPDVSLVDVSHTVTPQDVEEGAYLLASVSPYFPDDTIHLAVVDPGVGSTRRPVAISTGKGIFVGPDNGMFVPVLAHIGAVDAATGRLKDAAAVELTAEEYRRHPTSQTFHGRDIFAPAAAHLAHGVPIDRLGSVLDRLVPFAVPELKRRRGVLVGTVAHIDRFGNAITNIPVCELPENPIIRVGDAVIERLSSNYQEELLNALIGSNGCLEIAVRNGNAAQYLGVRRGDPVEVRRNQ